MIDQYLWKSFDFRDNGLQLLELLRGESHLFFLDSSQHEPNRGRYSFIGFDPFDVFIHKGKDTVDLLKKKFNEYTGEDKRAFTAPFSPLTSGAVGCLGYDYGLHQEKIKLDAQDDLDLPDAVFGFYDCILTIDHFTQKLYITSSGLPEKNKTLRQKRASQRLASIVGKIAPFFDGPPDRHREVFDPASLEPLTLKSNFSKVQYIEAVEKALEYIGRGDIYQVNLSQRFEFDLKEKMLDPLILYKTLRNLSPAPFGGYLDGGSFSLISNSPERFLRLNDRVVQTRPMKGTRPRGANDLDDRRLRAEILSSAKEKAELLMITDLQRNDLGRACDYGSVKVREMRTLEEYKYVFQATSTIEGVLSQEKDCFDLIRACFPGGSITGCPKIRAMEVIEELEPTRRGLYTGSMGYINFDGNMDLNILIRTLLSYRGKYFFQVGGGIVADSIPEKEYEETLVKAWAMRTSLESIFSKKEYCVG